MREFVWIFKRLAKICCLKHFLSLSILYWCFFFCVDLLIQAHTLSNKHALWCRHLFYVFVFKCIYIFWCYVQNNLDVISQLVQLKLPRVNFAERCVTDRLYPSGDAAQIVMSWPVRVTCHYGQVKSHQSLPQDLVFVQLPTAYII